MSTVARDMGAQPSLFRLWWTHGWFILLVYWYAFFYRSLASVLIADSALGLQSFQFLCRYVLTSTSSSLEVAFSDGSCLS